MSPERPAVKGRDLGAQDDGSRRGAGAGRTSRSAVDVTFQPKRAERLTSLKGARLGLFGTRPGGSSKATETSVYALLDAIGDQLDTWFGLSSEANLARAPELAARIASHLAPI